MAASRSLTLIALLVAFLALFGLVAATPEPPRAVKRAHEARGLFDMFAPAPKQASKGGAPSKPKDAAPAPDKASGGSEFPQRAW